MRLCVRLVCAVALAAGAAWGGQVRPVEVRQEKLTLPWYTCVHGAEEDPRRHNNPSPVPGSRSRAGRRVLEAVVLENEYLRLTILPEMGGAVARAVYKPTGEDLFFWEGKVKDWMANWESGVKANFPAIHHSVSTVDQPASWRVVQGQDGSATAATWMEFSRFTESFNGDYWGRYTNMLLSQQVTLRPGRGDFEVTWRIVNPAPYPQGAKIWNDALFPRNHTPQGVVQGDAKPPATDTEWIFPARYVSHHGGKDFRVYDPNQGRVGGVREAHTSVFAWSMPYGFAGLWYPSVKVNRLRLADPNTAPGAKQYFRGEGSYRPGDPADSHMYNFIELFGSMDNLMEGVEKWLPPGEAAGYSHRYTLIRGIGKVDFANEQAAIHLEAAGKAPALEAVTLSPVERLAASLDGKALGEAQPCGPDKPARFPLPAGAAAGRVILTVEGKAILDQRLPLVLPEDTSRHEWIRQCCDRENTDSLERYGDQFGYLDALRRLAAAKDAPPTTALGRMQYRVGRLAEAVKTLRAVTAADAGDGEAWHLLGCALLEPPGGYAKLEDQHREAAEALGKALAAAKPYPPARYFLALMAVRRGDLPAARGQLDSLVKERPGHWEGRLLKVCLDAEVASARKTALETLAAMEREDPADPRLQVARAYCAELAGDEKLAGEAAEALSLLAREPGAWRRIREFNAALRGVYYPPRRMALDK